MIEIPDAPVARRVAKGTIRPQPALVYVLLDMACHTFLVRILELRTGMAGVTLDRQMLAGQRKIRTAMIKGRRLPRCFGMAALAFASFLASVAIILPVAGDALGGELVAECSVEVTGLAGNQGMFPPQWITGVAIMVEGSFLPGGFKVAGLASRPEASTMHVLLDMASVAVLRGLVHVQLARVAGFAFYFRVRLAQAKTRVPPVFELERLP